MTLDGIDQTAIDTVLLTLLESDEDEEWIGVDLDGTLAEYDEWEGPTKIGKPVPAMARRIRNWVGRRKKVKIFTARADDERSVNAIKKWLKDNELPDLEITNLKDCHMAELWDDRAVAVEQNTGKLKEAYGADDKPGYAFHDDDDTELEVAARSPFTAHDLALRRNKHHPKLWQRVKGSPYEREYRKKFNPTEALISHLLEDDIDTPWHPLWRPHPMQVLWFQRLLSRLSVRATWEMPGTGQKYLVDKANYTVTLIHGDPRDEKHWHDKNKIILNLLGFRVIDGTEPPPDEMTVTEALVQALLEDGVDEALSRRGFLNLLGKSATAAMMVNSVGLAKHLVGSPAMSDAVNDQQHDWQKFCVRCHAPVPRAMLPICSKCSEWYAKTHAEQLEKSKSDPVRPESERGSRFDYAGGSEDADYSKYAESRFSCHSKALIHESPRFDALKSNRVDLEPEERRQVMAAKAVWPFGKKGADTPAIHKSVVKGKTWYWSSTHRCYQADSTLKSAIKSYHDTVEPSA
jgi:hypothetical protein